MVFFVFFGHIDIKCGMIKKRCLMEKQKLLEVLDKQINKQKEMEKISFFEYAKKQIQTDKENFLACNREI